MTYLMSTLKCALLSRQEGAGTVGYWWRQMCRQNLFFCQSCTRFDGGSANPPPRAIEGRRGDVRILGGGRASLPALNTLCYQIKMLTASRETEESSSSQAFLVAVGQFLHPGSTKLPAFGM